MFGKVNKKETIIAGNCVIESGLNTTGNIKIYGKINGSIKVDGDVTIGETGVATATITPANAYNRKLSWTSSDESVLYIDEFSGQYIALELGTITITATATDGSGVSATAQVYITDGTE